MPKEKLNGRRLIIIIVIVLIVLFGVWYFLNQRSKRAEVEVWGTSAHAVTAQIENSLLDLKEKLGGRLTIDIHLVCAKDEEGQFQSYAQVAQRPEIGRLDIEENKRQLVIKKYWPSEFWKYISVRNQGQNIYDLAWEKYVLYAGLDKDKVSEKVEQEGDELLSKEIEDFEKVKTSFKEKYGQELAVVPVVLINGQFYEGSPDTMSLAAAIAKPILRGKRASLPVTPKIELFRGLITFSWPISYSTNGLVECYAPLDCNDKSDKNGECVEVGTSKAHCVYTEPVQVGLTVLTSKDCLSCNTDLIVNQLKRDFKGLKSQEIDVGTAEGKALAEGLGITSLPAYIFEPNVQQAQAFQYYSQNQVLQPIGQAGQMTLAQVQPQVLLSREKKEKTMDLWIMSYCPYGTLAENKMINHLKKKPESFTLDIRYIVSLDEEGKITSLHEDKEIEENKRQLVIKKYYSDKFFDYLLKRNENLEGNWEEVATGLEINVVDVKAKVAQEGESLLKEEANLASELSITASPTYFWENQQFVNAQDLTKIDVFSDLEEKEQASGSCQ